MNELEVAPVSPIKRRRYAWRWMAAVILILLAGAGGYKGWLYFQERADLARRAEIQAEAAARIEDEWGIRIVHVALIAEGGLLDLRYQVTDPDKAYDLFDAVENIPRIIAENGTEIALNDSPHTHDLEFGLQYFFILRNIDDSVKPGSYVTVAVGDLLLPYVSVES